MTRRNKGKRIGVYDLLSGSELKELNGHFEAVTSCVYRPHHSELLSASHDRQLLCWLPQSNARHLATQRALLHAHDELSEIERVGRQDDDTAARNTPAINPAVVARNAVANGLDNVHAGLGANLVASQFEDRDEWSDDDDDE